MLMFKVCLYGQHPNALLREGNKLYNRERYNDAEVLYRKSMDKNKDNYISRFNLGASVYKQNNYKEAEKQFELVSNGKYSDNVKSKAYYNLGNSLLKQERYSEAIEAYKKSLKINSKDNDAKYNLSYALKKLMMKQQQNKNRNNDNKNQNNNRNQGNKENNNQNNKDNKEKENNKENKSNNNKQGMSKEEAERLLKAIDNEEKNLQNKLKNQRIKYTKKNIEKDW